MLQIIGDFPLLGYPKGCSSTGAFNSEAEMTLRRRDAAFSLLELLAVIAILGALFGLMLPAIQSSREAARMMQCRNNLRQIAAALLLHHDAQKYFPSSGWHFTWAGEPERGTGLDQPGSWIFNLLDYINEQDLRALGTGLTGDARANAIIRRCATPLSLFICPTRRAAIAYPQTLHNQPLTAGGPITKEITLGARSDYASSVGAGRMVEFYYQWAGPQTLQEGDRPDFIWPTDAKFQWLGFRKIEFNGVIYSRSRVTAKQITDGASKTLLVAEKYLTSNNYENGRDSSDNENMYFGFNNDVCRSTISSPLQDAFGYEEVSRFGSAHLGSFNAAMCDGSVQAINYDIDEVVYRGLGSRDGADSGSPE
jgi:prepilin-type N-terminal cleavage/methylation domain-containing protein/prepilin-type processing-associated H-X9-DG protein